MALVMDRDELAEFLDEAFPQVKGDFAIDALDEDELVVRLKVEERHLRPGGTVSGPNMFALADVGIYIAILARIGRVALAVTTNASMDFMRKPAAGADLIAKIRVLKLGRVLAVGDALIYSEGDDRPVARASMTYSIPPRAMG
ncbi:MULTISPECIES: PaaI family thioesterase [Thioclava]|uniref:Thioesterase n=1 Tax=Thioclava nitratireducens TaxID=1915078 RepID=A0ABN4XEB2_9RHOB|nr:MULTISPECIES: PaaI family thioesterase [Thioclava]MAQ37869.1 thioesterase [Thioclava sp.]AQS48656.1 thioesterase [Thioclava nitratireducens]OOY30934.1 thioesterase [Thioclava sp. F36-6]OWY01588.1 thioesterase [Thioclava sp. IC9]OWY12066.1 thioesterase [Thioclava sp. F34-6]